MTDNYEQFIHSLFETDPIEITPDMIDQDLIDELNMLENLSQESLCQSCEHKQTEHTGWCYMFKEMFKNCRQFRKRET